MASNQQDASVIFAEDKQGLSAHHFSVMAEQKPKWICPLCTYVNWPRSSRCTVCQSPRDLPSIEDEMERLEIIESRSNKLAGGGWSCPSCTYENWAASSRCTQCGTSAAGSTTISQLKVHSESSHPHSSFTMAQLTDVKWVCSVCTYQNWPSSKRCVMCQSAPVASHTTTETPSPISLEDAFISACKAVVLGHDHELQKLLLSTRKDIFTSRRLTGDECNALKQWFNCHHVSADESPFRQGANLVELASTCHRRELVSLFLALSPHTATPLSSSRGVLGTGCKRSLCMSSPSVAKELRLHLDSCVHQRKGEFGCSYLTEFGVFALPSEANEFPLNVQEILLNELCDSEVQTELEIRSKAINWWVLDGQHQESTSRLLALWNRNDGDCLLDSLMQSCWGIFDKERTLRQALAASLTVCEAHFFSVWRDYERQQAADHYSLDDHQLLRDWRSAMGAASLPREPLEQIHIFVLAHILRRPIIVYSVKYIHNYRDEPIGLANFQGVYLPVLWERSFCSRNPVVLGYTRGHFSALIPTGTQPGCQARCSCSPDDHPGIEEPRVCRSNDSSTAFRFHQKPLNNQRRPNSDPGYLNQSTASSSPLGERKSPHSSNERSIYLPLFDRQGQTLPTPFVCRRETTSHSDTQILRERLDTVSTRLGLLLARLRLPLRRHHLVETIVHDWLSPYRSMIMQEEAEGEDDGGGGQEDAEPKQQPVTNHPPRSTSSGGS